MFTSVRSYQADPSKVDEILGIVDQRFVPAVADLAGLCSYQVIDCGDGLVMTVSCFTTEEGVERSTELATDFVRDELSDFQIERTNVSEGPARISVAQQAALEPAHA